jgi:RNA polymerase sigma-70 factor (ECF subfamily)
MTAAEFDAAVRAAIPGVLRLAMRLTNDAALADDVAGEALLRAARGYPSFRGEAALSTWLHTLVVRAFRDQLRRQPKLPEPTDAVGRSPADLAASKDSVGRLLRP